MSEGVDERPLISICIPTFNRSEKVYALVQKILAYKGTQIEVFVLDNCSTDDTAVLLSQINDKRFRFKVNEQNIGGPLNHLKIITLAKGKYAVFCLDKDGLKPEKIDDLIEHITAHEDVAYGYCNLYIKSQAEDVVYEKGFHSVLNMAYLSQHPTGLFYKTDEYSRLEVLKSIFAEKRKFPFYPDVMNGEMAMHGRSLLINIPAFYTETKEECESTPSFTYLANDAFFSPNKRIEEFDYYIEKAQKLGLGRGEQFNVIKTIYGRCLIASTIGFKKIMADKAICVHYGVNTRSVGVFELIKSGLAFGMNFLRKKSELSFFKKLYIIFQGYAKVLVHLVLLK
jgi:glycosyltransferase involved in cell wall biosynthesis